MSSRLPRSAIHLPMIVSELPMFGRMYVSAVSMKLPPAAAYASRIAKLAVSSAVQPKTLPPRHRRKTSSSVLPRWAISGT